MSTDSGLRHIDHLTYINTWAYVSIAEDFQLCIDLFPLSANGRIRFMHKPLCRGMAVLNNAYDHLFILD